ncbi:MAG: acyltransferase family protein [Firmicutes bacterium]|nr:acyltransferase family protein [Bacillota bacterium]
MNTGRNAFLSITKLIAACFVVCIHCSFPGQIGSAINCIARFAVPFFFITSGYYAFNSDTKKLMGRLKKAFVLLTITDTIYFFWECYSRYAVAHENVISYISSLLSLENIARVIFAEKSLFSSHIWYLIAIVKLYVFILIYLTVSKRVNEGKSTYSTLYFIGICTYLLHIAFSLYVQIAHLEVDYIIYRNSLFFGIPMFALGIFLHEYKSQIVQIIEDYQLTSPKLWIIIFFGVILSLIQWFGIGKVEMPLGMLIVAITLFILIQTQFNCNNMSKNLQVLLLLLEKTSIFVYIFHVLIKQIIVTYSDLIPLCRTLYSNKFLFPLITICISVFIGMIIANTQFLINKARKKGG